ncbi:ABC-F family ATP-binding cassette domain-containing protein [Ignatzschineria cameli]|uniref:Probable ATP-binding protein YheS n=1 Tax=Ignatzschineria cameli TaxID=2182793 RepID=A0A2U2ARF5_9GAMM|nr:ATP-binding cassette domain-containing protein [Ignatzschineria cameli]PWD86855.1 ABC transporter [Ignatzschineria cameli]PWD91829.1 ABC transporter [Ignatzschineria cameli]PWD93585.1 ABC transporter [Ignatzschineria cameli]PWD94327.1 ABC transporter [Ignatzschineria cameli]
MIEFQNLTIRMNANILIDNFNFSITPRMRVGLVGKNGTGKTTLFNTILGRHEPDKGEIHIPKSAVIAEVAQEIYNTELSAFEYILSGDEELLALREAEVEALAQNDADQIAHIYARIEEIDGYRAESRAYQLLDGLGFKVEDYHKQVKDFSGGWRMRLNIGKALMCRSDILLLDEPTNHLDFETVVWVENWLKQYPGILIVISHDRDFLDNICTQIIHLYQQRATVYSGNYSAFLRLKAEKLAHQQAQFEKNEKTRAHLQKFIDRFSAKATKAKQAQSRVKALEKLEDIVPVVAENEFSFQFQTPERLPDPLIRLDHVSFSYQPSDMILKEINFTVTPETRVGILGRNGEGKSTLIKLIAGENLPTSGTIIASEHLKVGYFSQHQVEYLTLSESPIWHLTQLDSQITTQDARNFLGSFGFHGDKVLEAIAPFSGGEKARLALALIVYQKPNLLLLDEPTNHLDIEMREAIAMALQSFSGGLLMVSHDASLLELCCDQFLLVANQSLKEFKGDLEDYRQYLIEQNRAASRAEKGNVITEKRPQHHLDRETRKKLQTEQRRLTKEIEQAEKKLAKLALKIEELEQLLGDPSSYETLSPEQILTFDQEKSTLEAESETLEEAWLEAAEKREEITEQLEN